MEDKKEKFKAFCEAHEDMPLFMTYDWMRAAAGDEDNWGIALTEDGNGVTSAMPYFLKKKMGFTKITQPPISPYHGIYIAYPPDQKYAKKLSYEKQICNELVEQLPKVDDFTQKFQIRFTNSLPFHWMGYNQKNGYTYVLEDLSDTDQIHKEMKGNIRREIKKAKKKVKVEVTEDTELVYQLKRMAYDNKDKSMPFTREYLNRIDNACKKRKCRRIFKAVDNNQEVHSILYLVWDAKSSYYLIGASDPKHKNSGAMSLLMWEAILFSSEVTEQFNFEGSMIEPIERYFRSFGAKQQPYHIISKTHSPLLRLKKCLS